MPWAFLPVFCRWCFPENDAFMTPAATILVALGLSMDAFAASVAKGAELRRPKPTEALRIASIFGAVEGCMPIVGWFFGLMASSIITMLDHWIAFFILTALGVKMIVENMVFEHKQEPKKHKKQLLLVTAFGTSIDSMGVGVSLAFIDANIWIAAVTIGLATFTMSAAGVTIGHAIGKRGGKIAGAFGGAVLIGIGVIIVLEHTGAI